MNQYFLLTLKQFPILEHVFCKRWYVTSPNTRTTLYGILLFNNDANIMYLLDLILSKWLNNLTVDVHVVIIFCYYKVTSLISTKTYTDCNRQPVRHVLWLNHSRWNLCSKRSMNVYTNLCTKNVKKYFEKVFNLQGVSELTSLCSDL